MAIHGQNGMVCTLKVCNRHAATLTEHTDPRPKGETA